MRQLAAAALLLLAGQAAAQAGLCDPSYDCHWTHADKAGTLYEFDFSKLCSAYGYEVQDSNGHSFFFNICGTSSRHCLPSTYTTRYAYGAAIQFYGAVPTCNLTHPECTNPLTNASTCCTQNCHVLGVGTPIWNVIDAANPATGGVRLTHKSVPSTVGDPDQCPYNPKTLAPSERQVSMLLHCDAALPDNTVEIGRVYENNTCHYVIELRTKASCGCAPNCVGKTCGSDGCGGYCSGAALAGGCPYGQVCMSGGKCCQPDCRGRDCGHDGCGGSCGTCGPDETCTSYQICLSAAPYVPVGPVVYRADSGGLAGSFFGGAFAALGMAGLFWFYKAGGKTRYDSWRMGSSAGSSSSSAGSSSAAEGSAATSLGSAAKSGGYGSYGSSGSTSL